MTQTEVSSRYVEASQMFGEQCTLAIPAAETPAETVAAAGDPLFQMLCLLLLFAIAFMLQHRNELISLAAGLVRGYGDDLDSGRNNTPLSDGFFRAAGLAGILTVIVAAVKLAAPFAGAADTGTTALLAGAALGAAAFDALYGFLLLQAVGLVTADREFIQWLIYVKRAVFSAAALLLSPVVLLSALSPEADNVWMKILAAECFILLLLFLKETFVLFIRKKVPIFQWFLYLCTVEAFPILLICASIARLR